MLFNNLLLLGVNRLEPVQTVHERLVQDFILKFKYRNHFITDYSIIRWLGSYDSIKWQSYESLESLLNYVILI